jgi:peptidoglycan/LPS O-acetylase OafA/YrhL
MIDSQQKNLEIEALRGVTIIITIAAHLRLLYVWAPSWFEKFASNSSLTGGVDLFFCISGFVIARSVLPKLSQNNSWRDFRYFAVPFWVRRMWRLWPAALLWLAIYVLATAFFNTSGAYGILENTVTNALAAAFQVANFYFYLCIRDHNCGSAAVYWSLSLEEQFYFIFPIVLFALRRSTLAIVFIALFAIQFFIERPIAAFLWPVRTDAIICGVLLAMIPEAIFNRVKPSVLKYSLLRWITFTVLVFCLIRLPIISPSLSPGLAAVASAFLVWIAGHNSGLLIKENLFRKSLVYLGSRSYAIYLCHEAVFFGTREVWYRLNPEVRFDETFTIAFTLTAAVMIFLLSEATFRLVETPMRRKGRAISDKIIKYRVEGKRSTTPSHG